MAQLKDAPLAIIEGNQTGEGDATRCCANRMGMNLEQVRAQISRTMGGVLERLLSLGLEATVLVTGGDTLLAFMQRVRQDKLTLWENWPLVWSCLKLNIEEKNMPFSQSPGDSDRTACSWI